MESRAFRMQLKPGMADEYRQRHDTIWPELSELLRDAGIHDYAIFLDPDTGALFATLKLRGPDDKLAALPSHAVMRRWWDYMADLMEVEPDNKPREWPLVPMFHLP